jgi:integrase
MKIDDYTVHGFRSSFRDWAGEETDLPADLAEVALSHVVGGRVQTAYQRGDLLRKRQALMAAWTNYLANPPREAAVIPIKRKRKAAVSA